MKRLYLLRHAKSAWDDPALRDRHRPLAPRGRKAAKRMGGWAKKHRVRPQLVVCATAVRAEQTLKRVLPGLGEPAVWLELTLYAAAAETLLARVRTLPDEVDEAMLVGHNPGPMDLLLRLAAPSELRERAAANVSSGALAELKMDVVRWADVSHRQRPTNGVRGSARARVGESVLAYDSSRPFVLPRSEQQHAAETGRGAVV